MRQKPYRGPLPRFEDISLCDSRIPRAGSRHTYVTPPTIITESCEAYDSHAFFFQLTTRAHSLISRARYVPLIILF